jgi:hypothetical protein
MKVEKDRRPADPSHALRTRTTTIPIIVRFRDYREHIKALNWN